MNCPVVVQNPLQPLDALILSQVPEPLTGKQGTNRAPREYCQIVGDDDLTAVQCWLNEFKEKRTTYRVYEKEVERLVLWCLFQHGKPLSSLRRDDFETYVDFLKNPEPKALWCGLKGGKGRRRGSSEWRPFVQGLTSKGIQSTLTIVNSLFTYWVDIGYILQNPLKAMKRLKQYQPSFEERKLTIATRVLEPDEWDAFMTTLENLDEATPEQKWEKERLRFIVYCLFFLGLRISELAEHTWSSFREIEGKWWFVVRGKGDNVGKIPVHNTLWKGVIRYRAYLGYPLVPNSEECAALVPSMHSAKGLQPRQLNNLLKRLGEKTSLRFNHHPQKAAKMRRISAHWLRHQSATIQARSGIDEAFIQENHRHSKRETTRLYIHTHDEVRHNEIQKMEILNCVNSYKES